MKRSLMGTGVDVGCGIGLCVPNWARFIFTGFRGNGESFLLPYVSGLIPPFNLQRLAGAKDDTAVVQLEAAERGRSEQSSCAS